MLDIESQPSEIVQSLEAEGVVAVAVTIVDNAGVARVKTVPLAGLERTARDDDGVPAHDGPAYGFSTLCAMSCGSMG